MKYAKRMKQVILTGIMAVGLAAGLAGLMEPATARADSQGMPSTVGSATNLPSVVIGSTASNQTSVITVRANRGLALSWQFNATNTATATQSLYIYGSVDGTNLATQPLSILSAAANGTNTVTVVTNWSRAALEGYQYLNASTLTNAGAASVTSTNKGLTWTIPNN